MHLSYVTSTAPARLPDPLLDHAVRVWDRAPATLIGRSGIDVVVVDASIDVPFARRYCVELARLSVSAPVLVVASAETIGEVSAQWAVAEVVLAASSPAEFAARLRRAQSRRSDHSRRVGAGTGTVQRVGDFWFDPRNLSAGDQEQVIALSVTEAAALSVFLAVPDAVVTRELLLDRVWAQTRGFASRNVDTFICRLRRKLGRHGDRITTLRGVGYRFATDATHSSNRSAA